MEYEEEDLLEREKVIPFSEVRRLADAFKRRDGKPDNKRLAVLWLALTGARPCEIEGRKVSEIKLGSVWIWKPRKNQVGIRKEKLPTWFFEELDVFLDKGKYSNKDIFGITGESLARYINKYIRKKIGGRWLKKIPVFQADESIRWVYIWQLKDLRHNFQTLEWYKGVEKYGHDMALYRISKRMKHSAKHITGTHYIESIEPLQCNKYKHKTMGEIINSMASQSSLLEYS